MLEMYPRKTNPNNKDKWATNRYKGNIVSFYLSLHSFPYDMMKFRSKPMNYWFGFGDLLYLIVMCKYEDLRYDGVLNHYGDEYGDEDDNDDYDEYEDDCEDEYDGECYVWE